MTDISPDVRAQLLDLLVDAREHARAHELTTAEDQLTQLRTVLRTEVPDGELKAQLRHGLSRADRLIADEPLVAAEYLRAMHERLREADE